MCGILGFISKNNQNGIDKKKLISHLTSLLRHRGPDAENIYISSNKRLFLGHTRLSIQDLSNKGSQPMEIENGRFVISFNGEIYNHYELRKSLKYKWKSNCDTETLLICFEEWGITETLNQIDGMFAIILYDKLLQKIILIRDRYGEKPLYYGEVNGDIIFSSELKVFTKYPNFNNKICKDAVINYLKYNFIPSPYTIFENILKINQGSMIEYDLNKKKDLKECNQIEWFNPNSLIDKNYHNELNSCNEIELIQKCETLLESSVNSRLISDAPLGVFLSGGVDSSLVAYFASKKIENLNTHCVSFNEDDYNEGNIAKKTSSFLGSNHHEHKFDHNTFLNFAEKMPLIYDEPFSDISQLPTSFLSSMVSKNLKVALSGDGGDEFFGGYKKYLWRDKYWKKFSWIKYDKRLKIGNFLYDNFLHNAFLKSLFPKKFVSNIIQLSKRLIFVKNNNDLYNSLISNLYVDYPINFEPINLINITDTLDKLSIKHLDFSERMMLYDIMFTLSNGILCKLDRASMHSSLETRLPFLNIKLNKFALNLPSKYKINEYETKFILKKLLYQIYDKNIFSKNKTGFGVPLANWLRGELKEWSKEIIYIGDKDKIFDKNYFISSWDDHQQGIDNTQIIWNNIIYNLWSYSK